MEAAARRLSFFAPPPTTPFSATSGEGGAPAEGDAAGGVVPGLLLQAKAPAEPLFVPLGDEEAVDEFVGLISVQIATRRTR